MACQRGAAAPDAQTKRRLFAASAGYCQNPDCVRELFVDLSGTHIDITELAHVFAANDKGPRANAQLDKAERGAFDNLIALCPTCHTVVDKAPERYPDQTMLAWKREHANKLRSLFGVVSFTSRPEARHAVEAALRENRTIFENYGPNIAEAGDPESGAAERWKRKVLERTIPNNRRILALIDANTHLLSEGEMTVLEKFRQHVDDFEARHLDNYAEGASRFPDGMESILKD